MTPVDIATPVETDAEVALFFTLHQDAAHKNRDGSDNFIQMAAQFNKGYYKQIRCMLPSISMICAPMYFP